VRDALRLPQFRGPFTAPCHTRLIAVEDFTSFQDTGLASDTTYDYRAQGYNTVGDSAWSNVASVTIGASGPSTCNSGCSGEQEAVDGSPGTDLGGRSAVRWAFFHLCPDERAALRCGESTMERSDRFFGRDRRHARSRPVSSGPRDPSGHQSRGRRVPREHVACGSAAGQHAVAVDLGRGSGRTVWLRRQQRAVGHDALTGCRSRSPFVCLFPEARVRDAA
jgi:hypothetical protein